MKSRAVSLWKNSDKLLYNKKGISKSYIPRRKCHTMNRRGKTNNLNAFQKAVELKNSKCPVCPSANGTEGDVVKKNTNKKISRKGHAMALRPRRKNLNAWSRKMEENVLLWRKIQATRRIMGHDEYFVEKFCAYFNI